MMPSDRNTTVLVDRLFRQSSGKMVAILTQRLGIHQLAMIEDIVQEAFMQALQSWKMNGYPNNPEAWLMRTAYNRAIDRLRQRKLDKKYAAQLSADLLSDESAYFHEKEIADSQLRMVFACCHPALSEEDQIALTLKTVFSFSTGEIGKALLTKEATIQKRLVRARLQLVKKKIALEIPAGPAIIERRQAALSVLYLLFNEGYYAPGKDEDTRFGLCVEAMACCKMLAEHPVISHPDCFALLALMCLHAARFNSRSGNNGSIILLEEQDRSLWDQELIQLGYQYLNKSAIGSTPGQYQLEAAIAAEYTLSTSFSSINWNRLLQHYDLLIQINPSPHVQLSRALVLSNTGFAQKGIGAILEIAGIEQLLLTNHLYSAVLAHLYMALSEKVKAREYLQQALELSLSPIEKELLQRKILDTQKN